MFDHTHATTIENASTTPESATAMPPVRLEFCGSVVWIRPSNVLRIEVRPAHAGWPDRVVLVLSDSKEFVFSGATVGTADAIAVMLWPTT